MKEILEEDIKINKPRVCRTQFQRDRNEDEALLKIDWQQKLQYHSFSYPRCIIQNN